MDQQLTSCLNGDQFDYLLPFFWLHGEPHAVLREEIQAIYDSGCRSFCAESRPYPDFCGDQWWEDFGFLLKTAKELGMHVWLLDDAHFPSGYANGGVKKYPHLRRRHLLRECIDVQGPQEAVTLLAEPFLQEGDSLVSVTAYKRTGDGTKVSGEPIDLTHTLEDGLLRMDIPEGLWRVYFLIDTQRSMSHPHHVDMLNPESTHLMISEIYEPQYQHFAEYFGNTFQGFFSDEPGFKTEAKSYFCLPGTAEWVLPWRADLPALMAEKLGLSEAEVLLRLAGLWTEVPGYEALRVAYMDIVSAEYAKNFPQMLGDWCRAHGVKYIGHIIEDNGSASRLGHSAGHYFRSLDGQDWAGIDVVLHQIMPGQTEMGHSAMIHSNNAEPAFFTYALAKLGASHAHLNPRMQNTLMCEIFGAFGFAEGMPFMKKLTDHMLASGVNRFVPHAFSPKFPDDDCPPHFHCGGNYPIEPLFGDLMQYTQRVIHLLEGGEHIPSAAVYYNAQCEWAGDALHTYANTAKYLLQHQIDFDFVSEDHLAEAVLENGQLRIGSRVYPILVLPECRYLTKVMQTLLARMDAAGVPYTFQKEAPAGYDGKLDLPVIGEITLAPANPMLRVFHVKRNGLEIYMFKNDGEGKIDSTLTGIADGAITVYDAWQNRCFAKSDRRLTLDAGESILWILGENTEGHPEYVHPMTLTGTELPLTWRIEAGETVWEDAALLDVTGKGHLTRYAGPIRYTAKAAIPEDTAMLDLGFVGETAKLTLNGIDCGTRVAPPYAFDISGKMVPGENTIEIEVYNNPAYALRDQFSARMKLTYSGIRGPVRRLFHAC